ncbi:MAG: type I methionyl aminopeptidase [Bacilli bacterium]|nr:type I methionyl aminopeptidase [Bacilli bacterium]
MINIKTPEEIELMKKAGHLNYLTREYLKTLIAPGITTKELDDEAGKFITSHGGVASSKGFEGYPGNICISVNEEVVHGIPGNRVLKNGDIVTIDIVVGLNGYQADAAETIPVGDINKEKSFLLKHTEKALYVGLQEVKNGVKLGCLSARIEDYAKKHKLGVVHELVGHGIGKEMHEDPDVPNYGKYNSGITLKTGMTLAVEPMFTAGKRYVRLLNDDWTIVTQDKSPSAHFEHTIVVTDDGYEILTGE